MEHSESPKTLLQYVAGHLCDIMRLSSNIHPLVPLAVFFAVNGALVRGLSRR